jgi:hypothetical protein
MLKSLRLPYGLFLAAAAVGLPYVVAETLSRSRARKEFSLLPWQGSNCRLSSPRIFVLRKFRCRKNPDH